MLVTLLMVTMSKAHRKFDSTSHLKEQCPSTNASKAKSKTNRLSRSLRQSQRPPPAADVHSPTSCQTEFKTPTRMPRSRYVSDSTGESPHNESEIQQDIIWDATSPSPIRTGKRVKTRSTNPEVVNISEIVSRIAPKHGRPKVTEPTLQQWIGDSATIPCTPDVQLPKTKKKSPRPNGVDDLLKLAKQFDFNMFQQDEEEAEDMHQQSLELLSEDILDFENENELQPWLSESSQPAKDTVTRRVSQAPLPSDQHMEDDLDYLFDEPTQHLSGNLSQMSLVQSLEVKPAPAVASNEASGKFSGSSLGPTLTVSSTHIKGNSADNDCEDDWENDDLLNDFLVFEMTQNPQHFAPPKYCSTQRGSFEIQSQRDTSNIPANVDVRRQPENQNGKSAVSKVERENVKHRIIQANPDFQVDRVLTDASKNHKSVSKHGTHATDKDTQQSCISSSLSIETGSQRNWQTHHSNRVKSNPQESLFRQRTSVANSSTKYNTSTATSSNTSATKTDPMRPPQTEATSSHKLSVHAEVPAVRTLLGDNDLDEDLDSLFLSDSAWDDQGDDDLLCELCEELEKPVAKQPPSVSHTLNQRPALAPLKRPWGNINQQTGVKELRQASIDLQSAPARGGICTQSLPKNITPTSVAPGRSRLTGNYFAGNASSNYTASLQSNPEKESYRYMQDRSTHGTSSSTYPQRSEIQTAAPPLLKNTVEEKSHFTFKKPPNPVATVTNKALGKCSAAEIELKKQQAMERRRQRMQATQNLRGPT